MDNHVPTTRHSLSKPNNKVTVMGASKAKCIESSKENSNIKWQGVLHQISDTPPKHQPPQKSIKEGIVYGNDNLV
jgi:hypothetical protein